MSKTKKIIFVAALAALVAKPSASTAQDVDWSTTADCANDVLAL